MAGQPALSAVRRLSGERAQTRVAVLVLVCFGLGLAAGGFWMARTTRHSHADVRTGSGQAEALSESTQRMLQRLEAPVQIRFYALLDPNSVPEADRLFAERVAQLLARYERESRGKIKVSRVQEAAYATGNAAQADGVTAFNLDQGGPCYLGIALEQKGRIETLARLSPEWESALESDLTRAIVRLLETTSIPPTIVAPEVTPVTLEQIRKLVPNLDSASVEEGARILRESAQKEMKNLVTDLDAQLKEAEHRLVQAQTSGSTAEQEAARQKIIQLKADQVDKLKESITRAQAQMEALQRFKSSR